MSVKKLQKIIKRHPFLYLTRFRLLSKNSSPQEIEDMTYNHLNAKSDIPAYFYEVNQQIFKNGKPATDFETVIALSIWLKQHIKGGPGLSEPSEQALRTMLSGNGGVCSDMAQVFNNFCVVNAISVREWGNTSAPFNTTYGGHSFNEFYSTELQKWILIDVYWGFLFYDAGEHPLGVVEFYRLRRLEENLHYLSFIDESVDPSTVHKNYLDMGITPFLICGYRNKIYDVYLTYTRPLIPVFVVHFLIYALNRSYHYRFPLDDYKAIFQ